MSKNNTNKDYVSNKDNVQHEGNVDATKVINSLADSVGALDDGVVWLAWRARFVRLASLYKIDAGKRADNGYVNAVLERVATRGSSVSAVLEVHMLRESDDISLLDVLDAHFKLVNNPLIKIRKLKGMKFEESGTNLLDFSRAIFTLCQECGINKEDDQCLWVLACFGPDVMSKMPQDVLAVNTKEKMQQTLAAVMAKFDSPTESRAGVNGVEMKSRRGASEKAGGGEAIVCFACGKTGHYANRCESEVKLPAEEQQKLKDAFFKKKKKREGGSVKAISVGARQKMSTRVTVNGVGAAALIDTGSTITLVHPDVLKGGEPTRVRSIVAKFANGETAELREQVRVSVVADGNEYQHWMWVYPHCSNTVLLGTDFLAGKAKIDMVNSTMEFVACAVEAASPVMEEWVQKSRACLEKIENPKLREVVAEYVEKFYEVNRAEWLPCRFKEFEIKLADETPVTAVPYRYAKEEQDVIVEKFRAWIENGFARRSSSEYSSPALVVDKPQPADEKYRVCGNYRALNKKTVPRKYPMPNIEEVIDRANGNVFSVIDGYDAYHQVLIKESDVHKTALVSHDGKVELLRMQYGMVGAGFHFQEGMDEMLSEARGKYAAAVVDDVLVHSASDEAHVAEVSDVLERMFAKNFLPKFWKCQFGKKEVEFCGRKLSANGIGLSEKKVKALMDLRAPESKDELDSMIGLIIWHSKWIPRLGEDLVPLVECRKQARSGVRFPWSEECDRALERIKKAIRAATLRARTGPGVYHIYTDASDFCLSWHVVREYRGVSYLMYFGSHVLNESERRYSTPKKELFAIATAVKKSRWMCLGCEVVIHTDQCAWARELDLKSPIGVIAHWLEWINEVHPSAVFIKGERNVVADCLSRLTPVRFDPGAASDADVVSAIESEKKKKEAVDEWAKRGPVFVPVEWRQECMRTVHDGFLGAHLGKSKMWECLRVRYYWPGMAEDVKNYKCEFCDAYKPDSRDTRNPMTTIEASRPWEIVGVDLVPLTLRNREQVHYFIGVDYFTKKVVTRRLKVTNAASVINAFCFEILFPFGTPRVLISDRGTQLVGNELSEWCRERGIVHSPSTEYHQQGNGQCERMVRVLTPIILSKVIEFRLKFKVALAVATASLNKFMVSSTTGVSADHALFGVPPTSDFDLRLMRHLEGIGRTQKSVAEKSRVAKGKQKANYDEGKVERHFRVHQLVRVRSRVRGALEEFTGPAEVIKVLDRDNYVVWDYERFKALTVNVSNLRLFENGTSLPDASDVPIRNQFHGDSKYEPPLEPFVIPARNEPIITRAASASVSNDPFKPGARISVFWPKPYDDDKWYDGTIYGPSPVPFDDDGMPVSHEIDYDDIRAKEPNTPISGRVVGANLNGDHGEKVRYKLI
jgi:hypothetical protein